MKFDFDTYEFAALVAPGAVVIFGAFLIDPNLVKGFDAPLVIVGAAVAAYVAGHLVAAIGNLCERLFALFGARPLERVPFAAWSAKHYLSDNQVPQLREVAALRLQGDVDRPDELFRVVKQMRIMILKDGSEACVQRLETFNGLYNLSRGLATAFAMSTALLLASTQRLPAILCAVAAGLSCYRVWKFNRIYSRELIQQFLLLERTDVEMH